MPKVLAALGCFLVAYSVTVTALAESDGRAESAPPKTVGPRLVVLLMPLSPKRVDPELVATIDDLLAAELNKRPSFKVTTLADLNALFAAERLRDLMGCEDVSCSVEVGGAVGADRILTGSVGRIGGEYVISLQWLDAVYAEALSHASKTSQGGEASLARATRAALGAVLDESAVDDARARRHKRAPTFWTLEASVAGGGRTGAEPYNTDVGGSLRLAWGGRTRDLAVYFTILGGFGLQYFAGKRQGATGLITYSRLQKIPFVEVRAAVPVAFRNRLRIYAGVGAGLDFESYHAKQSGGSKKTGSATFPELRLVAGLWHRWAYSHSLFAHYRFRAMFAGDGADPVSELVRLGSTASRPLMHEVEVGWAFHF